ncbi:MAG: helix-turn-helix domain-containing protein [Candidatus Thorarchaeota archaeon]
MTARESIFNLFSKSFDKQEDLLCCAFGLRDTEISVYLYLVDGPKTVEEISVVVEKDRSTVQRVLNRLHKKDLVERRTQSIERGGYYYEYIAKSTERVRNEILAQLDDWYGETRKFLLESWPQTPQ